MSRASKRKNRQGWGFVVVTDPAKRLALAELYCRDYWRWRASPQGNESSAPEHERATYLRMRGSSDYLADHMHEIPVHVIPVIARRAEDQPIDQQASIWGSILPATWSFMLAARARGLGTVWTTVHLAYEEEEAAILGIPYTPRHMIRYTCLHVAWQGERGLRRLCGRPPCR